MHLGHLSHPLNVKWFITLDLVAGYWQVELDPRAKRATAFCRWEGLFQWNVMQFGLYNALATFQRLMIRVLARTYLEEIPSLLV